MPIFTCKGCPNRKPACHGSCEKYKREQIENEKARAYLSRDSDFNAYKAEVIAKANKRKHRR